MGWSIVPIPLTTDWGYLLSRTILTLTKSCAWPLNFKIGFIRVHREFWSQNIVQDLVHTMDVTKDTSNSNDETVDDVEINLNPVLPTLLPVEESVSEMPEPVATTDVAYQPPQPSKKLDKLRLRLQKLQNDAANYQRAKEQLKIALKETQAMARCQEEVNKNIPETMENILIRKQKDLEARETSLSRLQTQWAAFIHDKEDKIKRLRETTNSKLKKLQDEAEKLNSHLQVVNREKLDIQQEVLRLRTKLGTLDQSVPWLRHEYLRLGYELAHFQMVVANLNKELESSRKETQQCVQELEHLKNVKTTLDD